MKKFIGLFVLLIFALAGCSGAKEDWPSKIVGENFTITQIKTPFDGSYTTSIGDYSYLTEEEIVRSAGLIVKVEIIEEPVEYQIDYKYRTIDLNAVMSAFQGQVISVYYTDAGIKNGDNIKFLREEFFGEEDARITPKEMIHLKKGETYILFLDNFEDYIYHGKDIRYKYAACNEISPYFSSDFCRGIIECKEGNMYCFDQALSTLAIDAKESSVIKGLAWYEKRDENFDEEIQLLIEKYRK